MVVIPSLNDIVDIQKRLTSKFEKITEGLGIWTSFYRCNPHRLAIDYLGMKWLRPFQQMLVVLCFNFSYVMIIASRGMGKSLIIALVCVLKCILYPGIKIVVVAGKKGQSINVLNKIIDEFMPKSANLRNEISSYSTVYADAYIIFKNGSTIKVVTAAESARSARANLIIFDEFVHIKKKIMDSVLRKFKAGQRTPNFLNRAEYKNYPKEPNGEVYISSAYYKYHYSWTKFKSFFKTMIKGGSYAVLGFPYQLPLREGYHSAEQMLNEMQEEDNDSIVFSMEMESLFYGSSEKAFFSFDDIDAARKINIPLYPIDYYSLIPNSKLKYEPKKAGEIRLLIMDVATAGGDKNDATSLELLQLIPAGNNQYIRNNSYIETKNGGHTFDQSIRARQLFYDLECDYIAIDTIGVGLAVFDNLVQEQIDDGRNVVYPAWGCINDEKMNERCKDINASKVIYSIKANTQFNSDCAVALRDAIKRGKLRLLVSEIDGNEMLNKSKGFAELSVDEQVLFQEPFYQATALLNEMVNLDYEVANGKIRVKEASNMRKDRYSALSYGNWIANELERDLRSFVSDFEYKSFYN